MIDALNKAILCRLYSVSCKQDASDNEENTPEYTYQRNEAVFFLENSTDFVFRKLPEEIQSKIVYFYSIINEYSLRSRDVYSGRLLHAILAYIASVSARARRESWNESKKNEWGGRGKGAKETLARKPHEFAHERSFWLVRCW